MKIFLTGASGFIGSFFLRNLLTGGGHEVAILLRDPGNAWRIQDLLPQVQVICGDLNHLELIESELFSLRPDAFVHLAWNGVLGRERNASSQWRNLNSTMELIELASRLEVKIFIGLGSQAEYGAAQNKLDELSPANPTTMYGTSKLATQILSERLCAEYGIRYVWLRLFSSFGPADNSEWLIPYLIKNLIANERPRLTAAEQYWDYIYVLDVARAIRSVLESDNAVGIFNLGSGEAYRLRDIIVKIRDLIDPKLSLGFGEVGYRPDQVMYLQADISKIHGITGWLPNYDLDCALRETVSWYLRE